MMTATLYKTLEWGHVSRAGREAENTKKDNNALNNRLAKVCSYLGAVNVMVVHSLPADVVPLKAFAMRRLGH